MRTSAVVAALAVGALAVPYKRDLEVDYDVVYVTNVVTVTYGAPKHTSSPVPENKPAHYGHHKFSTSSSSTSTAPEAPVYTWPTSTPVEPTYPPPTTSSSSTSTPVYVAPTSTSTSTPVYVAPTTSSSPKAPTYESSSTSASGSKPTSYQEIVVHAHNLHRANHSAPDLTWSDDLASCAATIAASCVYAHNVDTNGGGYGQNIAAGVESNNISAIITNLFYNAEEPYYTNNYGLESPDMTDFDSWGHFSQIVWKSTTTVGCATQYCPNGLANTGSDVSPYFTVCNYKGPGNYAGEYADNVLKPLGYPTANWDTGL